MGIYTTLRPLLFRLPPETAHDLTLKTLALAGASCPPAHPTTICWPARCWAGNFPIRSDWPPGRQKRRSYGRGSQARLWLHRNRHADALPQQGTRARAFRLPDHEADQPLGFNNLGQVAAYHRLSLFRAGMVRRGKAPLSA